jgi:hypothetical protein
MEHRVLGDQFLEKLGFRTRTRPAAFSIQRSAPIPSDRELIEISLAQIVFAGSSQESHRHCSLLVSPQQIACGCHDTERFLDHRVLGAILT